MPIDSYAREKLGLAALELARSGEKKPTLRRLATSTLSAVQPTDFPDELRPRWVEIRLALTSCGRIDETMDHMTEKEAVAVARMIVDLHRRSKTSS
jgi:hypothetical protein